MTDPCPLCHNSPENEVPGWCPVCGTYPPPSYPLPWASIFLVLILAAVTLAFLGMGAFS